MKVKIEHSKGIFFNALIFFCLVFFSSPVSGQRIIGTGIDTDNQVYVWYSNGKVSVGTPTDLGDRSSLFDYSLPPGYEFSDVRGIAINPSNQVFVWYKNGMVSKGTASDLDALGAPIEYSKPTRTGNSPIFSVILQSHGASKLNVIKTVKNITGLGLTDSKNLVDNAPSVIISGITRTEANSLRSQLEAAGATAAVRRGNPTPTAAEPDTAKFSVILESHGASKLNAIKTVKNITGLGLTDSKNLVDNTPSVIMSDLARTEANSLKSQLEAVGATVSLRRD